MRKPRLHNLYTPEAYQLYQASGASVNPDQPFLGCAGEGSRRPDGRLKEITDLAEAQEPFLTAAKGAKSGWDLPFSRKTMTFDWAWHSVQEKRQSCSPLCFCRSGLSDGKAICRIRCSQVCEQAAIRAAVDAEAACWHFLRAGSDRDAAVLTAACGRRTF